MTTPDAAELHMAMFAAIAERDYESLGRLFAADVVHVSGDATTATGPGAIIGR